MFWSILDGTVALTSLWIGHLVSCMDKAPLPTNVGVSSSYT